MASVSKSGATASAPQETGIAQRGNTSRSVRDSMAGSASAAPTMKWVIAEAIGSGAHGLAAAQRLVPEVPRARRRDPHRDRSIRRIPRANAIEEVLHVLDSAIVRGLGFLRHILQVGKLRVSRLLGIHGEAAAMQAHQSLGAVEDQAAAFQVAHQADRKSKR